jgi:hypothetical protein
MSDRRATASATAATAAVYPTWPYFVLALAQLPQFDLSPTFL